MDQSIVTVVTSRYYRPWARYEPRAPPPPHILANLYFFEPLGCPVYEIGL